MNFEDYPLHDSIRGWFGRALYFEMQADPNIMCFTADLGYGLLDRIRDDFPNRFVNFAASEQCMLGAAAGATLSGRKVFCYSITTFLLFRGFEWVRNLINHERIPVRLVGSGLEKDYAHDGITHQPSEEEMRHYFRMFPNVKSVCTNTKEAIPNLVKNMVENDEPAFLCLRR